MPGLKTPAARRAATQAPSGTPDAMPFASVMTSGAMPACWKANHLPVRPSPLCTSSIISSQFRSSQIRRRKRT